ncbi:MAG: GDSL-type esterase/lipase family protein [Thermodesulfobacteriota bacterium]
MGIVTRPVVWLSLVLAAGLAVVQWPNLRDLATYGATRVLPLEERLFAAGKYQRRVAAHRAESFSADQPLVVFLGDSLTQNFPLERLLRQPGLVNRGISGDTTRGVLQRLDTLPNGSSNDVCFLMIGYNDLKYRADSEILANVRRLVEALLARAGEKGTASVVVQSILPVASRRSWANQRIRRLNEGLAALCQERGLQFLDLHSTFLNVGQGGIDPALTEGGVHLNDEGYRRWAKGVAPLVKAVLAGPEAKTP